jgi:hypothetical protein
MYNRLRDPNLEVRSSRMAVDQHSRCKISVWERMALVRGKGEARGQKNDETIYFLKITRNYEELHPPKP